MNQKLTLYLKEDLTLFDYTTTKKDKKIKISRIPTDNPQVKRKKFVENKLMF